MLSSVFFFCHTSYPEFQTGGEVFGLILRVTVLQTQSLYSVGGKASALYADSCRGALEQVHHLALLDRPT